ncbi:acanthoscurrin-1-like [Rhipicephalus sanguineus]|uniref:acanthoscurrin-1-like n=1 Tax=Rhipicephalus sanguineus TaxID=34632 RepID=UPI0018952187|nr:acanthoscurrin-1-like [Rhipicephalus sanguineus]XP_037510990.1 acanthoscurrin-1-like [Rhipicephalus sanguineus]
MRGVALSAVCLLCALVHIEAGGGGGYGGGAVIAKTTPVLIAASKPVLPSMGNAAHYLGYAGSVFEQLLSFSGHYGLPRGGGGGGKGLLGAVTLPVFSGNVVLGHGLGGGGGGGGAFLLGHGGGYGGGSLKTYKLAHSSYGIPVGLPVSLAHGWH